jgi:hypothetical protein
VPVPSAAPHRTITITVTTYEKQNPRPSSIVVSCRAATSRDETTKRTLRNSRRRDQNRQELCCKVVVAARWAPASTASHNGFVVWACAVCAVCAVRCASRLHCVLCMRIIGLTSTMSTILIELPLVDAVCHCCA